MGTKTPTRRRFIYCDKERVARNNLNLEYLIVEAQKSCKAQFIHIVLEDAAGGT